MSTLTVDPTESFIHSDPSAILEACGLIPYWVMEWSESDTDKPLKQYLSDRYGFGLYEVERATIEADGSYRYPEDEDLKPLISIETDDGTLYQYQYAFVAIPTPDGYFVCRMD